jgi:uncharacterized protein (TIGR02147 family)
MVSASPQSSVFGYEDYRLFLKDRYASARKQDPKFSHRYISAKLGFSSSSWFSDLINGRMKLIPSHLRKLAALFHLNEREVDYFGLLVEYNQSGSLEERNRCFRKMLAFKEMKANLVGREKFEFYGKWYYTAVRELLFFHEFRDDYATLAKRLRPTITSSQAKEAIQLLLKLDFIFKDPHGCLRPRPVTLKKDSSFKSLHAANFIMDTMKLGVDALDGLSAEERDVSALTLSFSKSGFQKAKAEIEILKKRLVDLMKEDPEPDAVYQINMQCFPLTQ